MKLCPKCGKRMKLGKIYCPVCGAKMEFVAEDITARAVEERRAERMGKLHERLIQWIALAIGLFVLACCFRDFARRIPEVDVPPFFYGPATIGVGQEAGPMLIGRGKGYLNLGRSGLPVPLVETLEMEDATPEEKAEDVEAVKKLAKARPVIITLKKDGSTISGRLLGRTITHLTLLIGNTVNVLTSDEVESVQELAQELK